MHFSVHFLWSFHSISCEQCVSVKASWRGRLSTRWCFITESTWSEENQAWGREGCSFWGNYAEWIVPIVYCNSAIDWKILELSSAEYPYTYRCTVLYDEHRNLFYYWKFHYCRCAHFTNLNHIYNMHYNTNVLHVYVKFK